jgi:hypothetical protein
VSSKIKYISILLLPLVMLFAQIAGAQWQNMAVDTLTVDNINKYSGLQSLDLDLLGYSHVTWKQQVQDGGNAIYYITNSPEGSWGTIEEAVGPGTNISTPCIAVSPANDSPYIVYASDYSVYIAYYQDDLWHSELISSGPPDNFSPTIAIDNDGIIHMAWITYLGTQDGYKIVYAGGNIGNWQEQVLMDSYLGDYGSGASPYIDVTSDGRAHIVYRGGNYGDYHIHHAYNYSQGGEVWQFEILYSGNVNDFSASLAIDDDDGLHLVCSGNDGWGFPSRIFYNYEPADSPWQGAQLISTSFSGTTPSIDLDIFGNPHIAWMEVSGNILTGNIYYSYKDDADTWQAELIIGGDHFEPCLKADYLGVGKMVCHSGGNTGDYDMFHVRGDIATSIDDRDRMLEPVSTYTLWQNYPNPFNEQTIIKYSIPHAGNVRLSVYNLLGKKVITLLEEYQEAGQHLHVWDTSQIAAGLYFYHLQYEQATLTKKAILLK